MIFTIALYYTIWISEINFVLTDDTLDTMLDPMCQAKCLKLFKDSKRNLDNTEKSFRNPFLIQSFCMNDDHCKGCIMGCGYWEKSLDSCLNYCKTFSDLYHESCFVSCNFINELKINRPGLCPESDVPFQCSTHCKTDSECFGKGTKCCKSRLCNSTCQTVEYPIRGVPSIPLAPFVRQLINEKNSDQIHFDLDWSNYNITSFENPILFVVQIRIGQLNKASNIDYGNWRTLIMTSKSGVIISAIDLEKWYQFRLLAFSEHGIRGVGETTDPITVNYKPKNPVPPKNISEKVSRIIDGKISVALVWQPGEISSILPLTSYKISWKRVYELNENNPLVTEYEISIPATETQYVIENLLPSAFYMVKIMSVLEHRNERYNSSAVIHYISTASIPQQNNILESINVKNDVDCICGVQNIFMPIEFKNAMIIKGQLAMPIKLKNGVKFDGAFAPYSFRIQWRPMACIESRFNDKTSRGSDHFQILLVRDYIDHYLTGLQYHCNYRVEIELFSRPARKIIKIWEGCFCTPSCKSQLYFHGTVETPCSNSDGETQSAHQLKVILRKSNNQSRSDAEIYWNSNPHAHFTSFRITWGPRLEEPIDESMYGNDFLPLLDAGKSLSKVVNYPTHQCILKDLNVGKIYIVKLQSIGNQSISQESSVFFKVYTDKNSSSVTEKMSYLLLLSFFFNVTYLI